MLPRTSMVTSVVRVAPTATTAHTISLRALRVFMSSGTGSTTGVERVQRRELNEDSAAIRVGGGGAVASSERPGPRLPPLPLGRGRGRKITKCCKQWTCAAKCTSKRHSLHQQTSLSGFRGHQPPFHDPGFAVLNLDFSSLVVARRRKGRPGKACDRGPRSRTRAVRRGGRESVTQPGRMFAATQ